MANNRPRSRLSMILSPSALFTASHANSLPKAPNSAPISHKEGSRPMRVKNRSRSLQFFSFPPASPTREGPSLAENPSTPHPSHSASRPSDEGTGRLERVTEPPEFKRLSEDSRLATPVSSPDLRRYSHTSPPRNRLKRRARINVVSNSNEVMPPGDVEPEQSAVSRSQSLRAGKKKLATIGGGAQDEEILPRRVDPLPEALSEKQRVMNVRRARKMQQVFGSEPPRVLLQTTHTSPRPDEERYYTDRFDKRGSTATALSISTTNLLSAQPLSRRQRTISSSSTTMGLTPPLTPTTPVPPQSETPTDVLPRYEKSYTHNPSTTPPFSSMFPVNTRTPGATPGTSKNVARADTTGRRTRERDFKQRRVRAAKLANFFGVGYQDLEPHLGPQRRTDVQKLEVAIDNSGGLFWDRQRRSVEMEDVIVRLRDLRSS